MFRNRERWLKVFVWFVVLMLVLGFVAVIFPAVS
jgi:hypothetical protein